MKKLIFILTLVFFTSANAEFTDAEKAEVYKWVQSVELTSQAAEQLALNIKEFGHVNRAVKARILNGINFSMKERGEGFARLIGVKFTHPGCLNWTPPPRSEQLAEALRYSEGALTAINNAARAAESDPNLIDVAITLRDAEAVLTGFNWALAYADPGFADNPVTPWDESRTVVGPHGHRNCAAASLARFTRYHFQTHNGLFGIYEDPPVWPSDIGPDSANSRLFNLIKWFAEGAFLNFKALAMHADVMSDSERALIANDNAQSAAQRGEKFFRAHRQIELTLNPAKFNSDIPIFSGRRQADGVSSQLKSHYVGGVLRDVVKVNAYEDVVSLFDDRGAARKWFTNFSDMWTDLDNWGPTALLFIDPFSPAPAPAPGGDPGGGTGITCGTGTILNAATNQCEAVPVSCPTLDHRFSITNPDGSSQTYECKLLVSQ